MTRPFSFLDLPQHPPKPRRSGLFIPGDSGIPLRVQEDFLKENHDLIDYIKLTGHVRLLGRYSAEWFERKIGLYAKYGIGTFPGGISFEIALLQGQTKRFFATLKKLGCEGVEISEDVVPPMPAEARREIIGEAITAGLAVFTEVGRKFPTESLSSDRLIELIQTDLDSGARMVIVERSEIVQLKDSNPRVLIETAKAVGYDKILFESHLPGPDLMVWLIRTLGPDVSLMGHMEYCTLAHDCRLGVHRRVEYTFLTEKNAKV